MTKDTVGTGKEQFEALLKFVQSEGRICPLPYRWNDLWEMLPDRTRVGSGWEPPLPLILAAWHHTSAIEKRDRLRLHIKYAAAKGILDVVDRFLRSLPQDQWYALKDG